MARLDESAADPQLAMRMLPGVVSELQTTLEELTVTEEELRQQNETLANARLLTEEALHKYQDLFEFAPDGYLVTTTDGVVEEANQTICDMLDMEPRLLVGRGLLLHVVKEDRAKFQGLLADVIRSHGRARCELALETRTGISLPSAVTVAAATRSGEVVALRWIIRDVKERRRNEAVLARAQRMESLGRLAGGIAHDFNNVLAGALGSVALARTLAGPRSKAQPVLAETEKALSHGSGLAQQLLTFAQGGAPVRSLASLKDLLVDGTTFAMRGSSATAAFGIPDDLWHCNIDRSQISQVITNLALNAVEAMPHGGTIRVSAENVTVTAADSLPVEPGPYVRFSVSDEGQGIAPLDLSRIFEPYFSTRREGRGLGLSVSASIVERHGGCITVDSPAGCGATFNVFLPASLARLEAPPEREIAPAPAATKVLFVDDETLIAMSYSGVLRNAGHTVVIARSGDEAVTRYREAMKDGRPFGAVIMDLTLPGGISGLEATRRILELDPSARVVVSSGYSTDAVMADFRAHGFCGVLAKPYTVEGLRMAIEICLAPRSGA